MRGVLLATTGVVALIAALGCGGAWNEGVAKAVSDQSSELRGKLMQAQESPERDAVEQLLQDFQQNPEGIGIIEFATFGAEVETAVQDGNVDGDELQAIQSKYDEIRTK